LLPTSNIYNTEAKTFAPMYGHRPFL